MHIHIHEYIHTPEDSSSTPMTIGLESRFLCSFSISIRSSASLVSARGCTIQLLPSPTCSAHRHQYTHDLLSTYSSVYVCIYVCVYIHTYSSVYTWPVQYIQLYIYIYIYIYMYTYICIYVYIYIYSSVYTWPVQYMQLSIDTTCFVCTLSTYIPSPVHIAKYAYDLLVIYSSICTWPTQRIQHGMLTIGSMYIDIYIHAYVVQRIQTFHSLTHAYTHSLHIYIYIYTHT